MPGGTMDHHANERMRCAGDGEAWPCASWLRARKLADAKAGARQPPTLIGVRPLRVTSRRRRRSRPGSAKS